MIIRFVCALLVIILTAFSASGAPRKTASSKSEPFTTAPAPKETLPEGNVIVGDQTIFSIKVSLFSFTPVDRAAAISRRIAQLKKSQPAAFQALSTIDADRSTEILAGDTILMSVTDSDADAVGKPRKELAEEYARIIKEVVTRQLDEFTTRRLIIDGAYAAVTTLVLIILLILINRFYPKVLARIETWRGTLIDSVRFQSIEIVTQDRLMALVTGAVRWTRIVLVIGLLYLYIPLMLSFFPWTRRHSTQLFGYITTPVEKLWHAVAGYLPNIFFIAVIAVATHYFIKFIKFLFSEIQNRTITIPGFYPDWAESTFKIVRFMIIAFAVVVAFPYLPGSDSPAFKGVSVFLGVLFSLGSTSAIANVVAGVILTYMRAFKLGDRVKIADTMGDVVETNLLVTRIRTTKNVDTTIPNAMVLGSHIINFSSSSQECGLILHTTITIGYDVPWRNVHQALTEAAKCTENILALPAPFVLQTSLDDFYVSYQLNVYTEKPSVMVRTYSELHQNIQDKFNEAGIEIMSPHYSSLRDGNQTTIPESYLPESYQPPLFKFQRHDACGTDNGHDRD